MSSTKPSMSTGQCFMFCILSFALYGCGESPAEAEDSISAAAQAANGLPDQWDPHTDSGDIVPGRETEDDHGLFSGRSCFSPGHYPVSQNEPYGDPVMCGVGTKITEGEEVMMRLRIRVPGIAQAEVMHTHIFEESCEVEEEDTECKACQLMLEVRGELRHHDCTCWSLVSDPYDCSYSEFEPTQTACGPDCVPAPQCPGCEDKAACEGGGGGGVTDDNNKPGAGHTEGTAGNNSCNPPAADVNTSGQLVFINLVEFAYKNRLGSMQSIHALTLDNLSYASRCLLWDAMVKTARGTGASQVSILDNSEQGQHIFPMHHSANPFECEVPQ